ncbi:hydrogenase assembly protein HupF [Picosynechococcus sp. PCC 7003]|uniref:HypC/HybG/HupF family hydrogenase formation chaperone n=1 Tax=Picosynechococcus sp. PCC 7003 TaxID=374981 RepID=UPI000810B56A|nr:HypC/HybG/HupF family hydrogenase formation chaperone [Picosynechococcus sp. PCC 7003]ANV83100.1 hydrogenase assembly protein HupF [Picosynechococcus sp. PCC 7003]
MCLAVPGKILEITGDDPLFKMGRVSFGGVVREVSLAYVPEAQVGDYAVVHAGFALSLLDEAAATETLANLAEMEAFAGVEP